MRIPRRVLAVAKIAARESSKYAFNGVHLRRKGDNLRAAASDGKRLMAVTWKHVDAPAIAGLEEAEKPVADYSTLIPVAAFKRAATNTRAKSTIVIDEPGTNGRVRLIAHDDDTRTEIQVSVMEGQFPPIDDVIPKYKFAESKASVAVRIGMSAALMAEMLMAMRDAVEGDNDFVILEVPTEPTKPIKVTRKGFETEAVGVMMPMKIPD